MNGLWDLTKNIILRGIERKNKIMLKKEGGLEDIAYKAIGALC